jgi:hypothetical protein
MQIFVINSEFFCFWNKKKKQAMLVINEQKMNKIIKISIKNELVFSLTK